MISYVCNWFYDPLTTATGAATQSYYLFDRICNKHLFHTAVFPWNLHVQFLPGQHWLQLAVNLGSYQGFIEP